jgi:hypothetical protein
MRGTGIDSEVEIYATKQSNEHQYTDLKGGGLWKQSLPLAQSGRWTKSETPVILCVIHHRQNPIESTVMNLRDP